jgi:hypothetical protein
VRRRAWILLATLTAGAGLLVYLACALEAAREPAVALPLRGDGVALLAVETALARSPRVAAGPGDLLLETKSLRLTVGASESGVERRLRRGFLLDLSPAEFGDDALQDARVVLRAADRDIQLSVESVTPLAEQRPALRIVHRATSPDVRLSTEIRVQPGQASVELTTTLENRSATTLRAARLGDRVRWPGAAAFSPGTGYVEGELAVSVPWVARRAPNLSYALVPPGVRQAFFVPDRTGPSEVALFDDASDVAAGETLRYRRHFVVVPGGLDRAAAAAWSLQKRRLGTIAVSLGRNSAWARLRVKSPDGRLQLEVQVPRASGMPLKVPAGEYRIELVAPGGIDEQRVRVGYEGTEQVKLIAPEPGYLRFSVVESEARSLPTPTTVISS